MIGQSGGRSAGNRQSGPRRAPQRERDYIDPPGRSEWVRLDAEQSRHEKVLTGVAWLVWTVACVVATILVCAWWGLL